MGGRGAVFVCKKSIFSISGLEFSLSSLSSSSLISSFWDFLRLGEEFAVLIKEVLGGDGSSPEVRSQEVVGLLQGVEDGLGEVSLGLGRSRRSSVDVLNSGELQDLLGGG